MLCYHYRAITLVLISYIMDLNITTWEKIERKSLTPLSY